MSTFSEHRCINILVESCALGGCGFSISDFPVHLRDPWLQPLQLPPVLLLADVLPHLLPDPLLLPWIKAGPVAALEVLLPTIVTLCWPPSTRDLTSPRVGSPVLEELLINVILQCVKSVLLNCNFYCCIL